MAPVPNAPLKGKTTVTRQACLDDADLLVEWHADPGVAAYWDNETYSKEQMLERLQRPDVDPYIIEHLGRPIGYLQVWFLATDPDVAGLDMFLVPAVRGQGLGPDAARTLATWLLGRGGIRRVTVDTDPANERAVQGWARAGFRLEGGVREPDDFNTHPWVLMVME
jgi:aminoglycoside 6'-N-acetyltransferase